MILTLFSGILSAFSLPTSFGKLLPDCGFLAWFSLVPLYLSIRKKRARGSFAKGFIFGLFYYGISLYWITISLYHYGDVPLYGAIGALIALVLILSLFTGAITFLSVWVHRHGGPIFWAFPLSWVAAEFLRNYFPFNGFPWSNLAYSQRSFPLLLQSLDLFGVYGIVFLIVLINASLGEVIYYFIREVIDDEEVVGHKRWGSPWIAVALALFFVVAVCGYGTWRTHQVREQVQLFQKIDVGLIQGNILQDEKWLDDHVDDIIGRYVSLSEELQKQNPALIIWPESSFPAIIPPEKKDLEVLANMRVPILMGMLTYEGVMPEETWPPPSPATYEDQPFTMYNGAALVAPKGVLSAWHFKSHLVPMGEYVPLKKFFFFLEKVVPGVSDFAPGKTLDLMSISAKIHPQADSSDYFFGTTICYEDLFPEISRAFVRRGADFLVNVTNDAWYDRSSAIFQHYDFSRFRAIENRRSMVRVTNTGLTGVFDPTGDVIHSFKPFSEETGIIAVPVGKIESFYTRYGDLFAWACVVLLSLLVILVLLNENPFRRGDAGHVE